MNLGTHPFRAALAVAAAGCLIAGVAQPATAAPPDSVPAGVPQLEALDRGLVAAVTHRGRVPELAPARLRGHRRTPPPASPAPTSRVYRDGERIATVTDSTNYVDAAGTATSQYRVAPVVRGAELERSAPVTAWAQGYHDLPLQQARRRRHARPARRTRTRPTTCSVGDVDGDGAYEYVVKWDPSNSKDVSQVGYTGPVYIDTYELDGTLLYRIDLGVNVRAGAHYTQFLVYDFDGDGRSEMMLKTAPGHEGHPVRRRTASVASERVHHDARVGRAGRLLAHATTTGMSAADYDEHLVDVFQGWTEHPEVVAGRWPATLEEAFGIAPRVRVPAVARGRRGAGRPLHRRVRAAPQRPQRAARTSRASSSTARST